MSMITCNEDIKGNKKCVKIIIWSIWVTNRVHLWLDGKRTVDFLSVII